MSYTILIDTNAGLRPLQVGDFFRDFLVTLIGTDFIETAFDRHYISDVDTVRRYDDVLVVNNNCHAHFFDRITGHLLLPDDITSTGWRVCGVYHECIVMDPSSTGVTTATPVSERRILFWEASRHMIECGVEARLNATPELMCGLPRTSEGRVPILGDVDTEIEHIVWYNGSYRRISELYTDGSIIGRFVAPDRPNYGLTDTGVMCPTADMVTLDDGRTASPFEAVQIRTGELRLASEVVRVCMDSYNAFWADTVPDGYELYVRDGTPAYWPSRSLVTLADTGERALAEDSVRWNDTFYSRRWADENLRPCEECGTYIERSACYCPRCQANARTRIRGYSNRASSAMPPEKDVPIKFGIELEVGCDRGVDRHRCVEYVADAFDRVTESTQYVTYKEDGSICSVDGFEIVTRPDCPSVHKRIWSEVLSDTKVLNSITSWRSGKCGMHIHVSRKPLSELWVGRMMVLVNANEFAGLLRSVAGRGSNSYSRISPKKFGDVKRCNDRYEALNIGGSHTIEFRMFRGTTLLSSFLKNIEFVEAVIDYCRPHARSLQVIGDPNDFLRYVSDQRKRFENLFKFLQQKGWYDS